MMAGLYPLSEAVYHIVNKIIGSQEQVKLRRDIWDIKDIIDNYESRNTHVVMTSGSMREGFNMTGSDYDLMYWFPDSHVICHLSQIHLYTSTNDIILMEDQKTRPGFVLLRLIHQRDYFFASESLVQLTNHDLYICSFKFRHVALSRFPVLPYPTVHGPCISGFLGNNEFDFALCYKSKHWPPQAYSWIERCRRSCWPSPSVLSNIIQNGCHFMPIGAKKSHSELVEWRLSFSQAEQKLVYCMNHCQFLVYGLLKLFLKEVLNKGIPDDKKLLCSYFMKTAVFWEIQQTCIMQRNKGNILNCFWRCYKCLMKWVYNEYCPNFFVPQNNMFYPKITGPSRHQLFSQMSKLYQDGIIHCLLRCSSIHSQGLPALLCLKQPVINTCSFTEYDRDRLLYKNTTPALAWNIYNESLFKEILAFLFVKLKSKISQSQRVVVYRNIIQICNLLSLLLQYNQRGETNTDIYIDRKCGLKLMEVTTKLGCASDVLYLAMYLYNEGRYRQTLILLQNIRTKLYSHYTMYFTVYVYDYIEAMIRQPMTTKLREAWACDIILPFYTHFPELRLELEIVGRSQSYLVVSPFVMLHFLCFLCYFHLDCEQQHHSLNYLYSLVHYDEGRYINEDTKDIAWIILGICHQLSENPQQALECYLASQRYSRYNKIQEAALYHIYALERYL